MISWHNSSQVKQFFLNIFCWDFFLFFYITFLYYVANSLKRLLKTLLFCIPTAVNLLVLPKDLLYSRFYWETKQFEFFSIEACCSCRDEKLQKFKFLPITDLKVKRIAKDRTLANFRWHKFSSRKLYVQ